VDKKKTISSLVMDYFMARPNQELNHGPVVDWVTAEWLKEHDESPRDVWRAIRLLAAKGKLIKVTEGVYMYDPEFIANPILEDFTAEQKREIFERDNYRCVMCGRGVADGVEIHADHIKPKSLGGKAEISNGQTLCAQHNFLKKNLEQTESGKKMFLLLYERAKKSGEPSLIAFCTAILETFEKFNINGHIEWKK
jgi:HNH endonuclease